MPTLAKKVFLSSTFLDLEDYRAAAVHACRRVGLIPVYMEDFPPDPRDAIAVCKAKVEEADLFLGIYAHRYGYVPDGSEASITEMEYDWAIERKLPVHLFVIDPDYPWPASRVDRGKNSERLDLFKERIGKKHTWKKFQDAGMFKEDVLLLVHDLARTEATSRTAKSAPVRWFLPTPPKMHSVPPYIQTSRFIGRRKELNDLDDWARSSDPVLVLEAIGGVGKSALTWEWARDRAMKAIPGLAGILWWSFYEGGASTESFVREALAYVTETDPEELRTCAKEEQVQRLLTELRRHSYLLVLDGFERLLTAYHQLDPSKLQDDQVKTDHRSCTNPRTEDLLRQLIGCSPSKFLITTRLMPSSLENRVHQPLLGVQHLKLPGLKPDEGENLLKSLGIHGDSASIRRFLQQFDNHSLLIGVLAGRISDYRSAPGNFDHWLADPEEGGSLRLSELDLKQRRTHILAYAFAGLDPRKRQLLSRIAVLSDTADYATLAVLNPYLAPPPEKAFELEPELRDLRHLLNEFQRVLRKIKSPRVHHRIQEQVLKLREQYNRANDAYREYQESLKASLEHEYRVAIATFDIALSDLENRGLLQWDRHSNNYDLHPVVRGHAFDQLGEPDRVETFERIRDHFESLPPENSNEATELSHLKNTIQIYRALIGAGRLTQAASLYMSRLAHPLLFRISSYYTVIELLTPMFLRGIEASPRIEYLPDQTKSIITGDFGDALRLLGRLDEARKAQQFAIKLNLKSKDWPSLAANLHKYSLTIQSLGELAASFNSMNAALAINSMIRSRDGVTACLLALARQHFISGRWEEGQTTINLFNSRPSPSTSYYRIGDAEATLCWMKFDRDQLLTEDWESALSVALQTNNLPAQQSLYQLRAEISLRAKVFHEAIAASERAIEITNKTGVPDYYSHGCIARTLVSQGHHTEALRLVKEAGLEGTWQSAEVYLAIGDLDKSKVHALRAYERAWADGPPHIFWWELENSKRILAQLGIPAPQLSPFDPSKIEPIPYEAEIRAVIEKMDHKRQ